MSSPSKLIATPGFCRRPHERPVLASAEKVFDYEGRFRRAHELRG